MILKLNKILDIVSNSAMLCFTYLLTYGAYAYITKREEGAII